MPRWRARSGGGNTNWTITREHDAPATRHEIGLDEGQCSQSVAGLNEHLKAALKVPGMMSVLYSIDVNDISVCARWVGRRARYQCSPSFEPSAAAVMIAGIPIATAASAIARASIMAIPLESASSQNV